MKQNAFTMAEVLVVLVLLGVVAALTIPIVTEKMPNRNKMMFKKSYHEAERVIADLINDERFYPEAQGFAYGNIYEVDGNEISAEVVDVDGVKYSGPNKFCMAIASKANILGSVNEGCTVPSLAIEADSSPSFIASNGTSWYIQNWAPKLKITGTTSVVNVNQATIILIDVNGPKAPNCRAVSFFDSSGNIPSNPNYNSKTGKVKDSACKNPDRFQFGVDFEGKITVFGQVEQGYLKSTKASK